MLCKCEFDPLRDMREVDPLGYVDLGKALMTGIVPSDVTGNMSSYNGIENPESILGTPTDVFDSMRMLDTINQSSAESGQTE